MIDSNAIVINYLLAQLTLTDVVGTDIYATRLPATKTPSTPMISLFTQGGTSEENNPLIRASVQFKCWHSEDPLEARKAYRALHDVLHQVENTGVSGHGFIIEALEEIHGQDTFDPDTKWPFTFASFRVILRNEV